MEKQKREAEAGEAEAGESRFAGKVCSRRNVLLDSDEPSVPLNEQGISLWSQEGAGPRTAGSTFGRNSGFSVPVGDDPVGHTGAEEWRT